MRALWIAAAAISIALPLASETTSGVVSQTAPPPADRVAPPHPGNGHLIYDEGARQLILIPEYQAPNADGPSALWIWRRARWERRDDNPAPPVRTLSAAAYDTRRRRLVLHGGLGARGLADPRADTWEWDGRRWREMADTAPGPRDHHSLTFDAARGETLMFGGVNAGVSASRGARPFTTDTWIWDGRRWRPRATTGPAARGSARMVYDAARKVVALFGGVGADAGAGPTRFGDTWIWNGAAWRIAATAGPSGRNGHAMAFDRRRGVVLLWGGTAGGTHLDDFWAWDGVRWSEIRVDGPRPGARVGAQMADDTARRRVVLYGGRARVDGRVTEMTDVWAWDGKRWTLADAGAGAIARGR